MLRKESEGPGPFLFDMELLTVAGKKRIYIFSNALNLHTTEDDLKPLKIKQ